MCSILGSFAYTSGLTSLGVTEAPEPRSARQTINDMLDAGLFDELMNRVDALVRVDERRWNLQLKDGSQVLLPATDQDAALIQLDLLDQRDRLLDLGFAQIDLRVPGQFSVRRPGASA